MEGLKVVQKQGIVDEEGEILVPIEYQEITELKSGVFVCKKENSKLKRLWKQKTVKDQIIHHLYTKKGRVNFSHPIIDYKCDDKENIVAIKIEHGWKLVQIDLKRNIIKVTCSILDNINEISGDFINIKRSDSSAIYSIEKARIILGPVKEELKINDYGIVSTYEEKQGFYNYDGELILECNWKSVSCYDNYILVIAAHRNIGVFSYSGKEIIPCECSKIDYIKLQVEGKDRFVFLAERCISPDMNTTNTKAYAFVSVNGDVIMPFSSTYRICVKPNNTIILNKVRSNTKELVGRLKVVNGVLSMDICIVADEVSEMDDNNTMFRVVESGKVGLYTKEGKELIPMKYDELYWNESKSAIIVTSQGWLKKEVREIDMVEICALM